MMLKHWGRAAKADDAKSYGKTILNNFKNKKNANKKNEPCKHQRKAEQG